MSKGDFVWYDYMAKDTSKAIAFYSETIGWKTQQWEGSEMPYTMFAVGENTTGGVMQLPEEAAKMGAPPHWLAYISTPDADATAKQAEQLGGKVLNGPFDIPTVGRAAILQDPQGAVFAAFTPASGDEMTMPSPETPGAFCWSELMSADADAAYDFYSALFGWTKGEAMEMGEELGTYQIVNAGEKGVGGMMNLTEGMPMSAWIYYVSTDDMDAAMTRIESHGGKCVAGPMEVPGGRYAAFLDSQGGAFGLHQAK